MKNGNLELGMNAGGKVTGSKAFSELIEGGVKAPASITLMGGPGTGKTYVALNFIWEGLRNGETCVHICASQSPRNVRRTMRSLDWDFEPYEEEGKLVFVDAYPGRIGKPDGRYYIEDPYDTTLYGGLLSALKEDGVGPDRLVFDSFTSLCSQFEPGDVIRVLKRLQGYVESLSAVGLFVGEEGCLPGQAEAMLMHSSDVTLHTDRGEGRTIEVLRSREGPHDHPKAKLEIRSGGVRLSRL